MQEQDFVVDRTPDGLLIYDQSNDDDRAAHAVVKGKGEDAEKLACLISAAPQLAAVVAKLLENAPDAWTLPGAGMFETVMTARRALDKANGRS